MKFNISSRPMLMISAFISILVRSIIDAVPVHVIQQPKLSYYQASSTADKVYEGLKFLRSHRYLITNREKTTLPTNDEIKSALVSMQRFAGLEQTGKFDDSTLEMMRRPRCGMADVIRNTRLRRYNVAGVSRYRWFTNELTYKIDNYPTHSMTDMNTALSHDQVDDIIAQAFKVWSNASALSFSRIKSDSEENADIHLVFGSRDHTSLTGVNGDPEFDGEGGTLAHGFYPNSGWGKGNGDVHFDDDETFTHLIYSGTNLFYTTAHEIGHALGLLHSDNTNALMWPYQRVYNPNFELPADDVAGIQAIYGPRPTEEPPLPVYCNTTFNAVAVINDTLYVFSDTLLWKFTVEGDLLTNPDGEEQDEHFKNLPRRVHAVYQRSSDDKVVFFKGKKFYVYDGQEAETPVDGSYIRKNLDNELPKLILAALHSGNESHTYFLRATKVWRYDETRRHVVKGFPQEAATIFPGYRKPTGAFFEKNGHAVILNGREYNKYNANNDGTYQLISDEDEPRNFAADYLKCP